MANTALGSLLHYLRRVHDHAAAEATDGELLRRHVGGDKTAFAALVRRHAPMVWAVCRRLLDNEQDAEDAFQAAFLVLMRKAESLRAPQSLAAFLHGVASRIARKARVTGQRRARHEARAASPSPPDPFAVVELRELRALLDEELLRLPEKYRAPLVLCYLEGLSYTEAAKQLGWRDGTVCGRLARARELLRQRLSRRGLTLSGAALAAALTEPSSAPAAIVAAVGRMAALFALGQAAAGSVSPPVAALAQSVLQAMTAAKLKTMAALVVEIGLFAAGASLTASHFLAMKPPQTEIAVNPPSDKPTTWKSDRTDRYGDPMPAGAVARLGTLRFRHEGEAWSLAFSADGKFLASTSRGGLIYLWDSATGKELRRINTTPTEKEYSSHVYSLAFSPDGKMLASRGIDDVVRLWDVATGKERQRIAFERAGPQERGRLRFSPDGKVLAFDLRAEFPRSSRVMLLDVATGKEFRHLDFKDEVRFHSFSPDGKAVAVTVGIAPGVQLWHVAAGKLIRELKAGTVSMAFSPDGKLLASGDNDRRIVLTDVETGEEISRLEAKMDLAMSLAFSPDGKTLLSGNQDGKVRLWDVATKKLLRQFDARMWMIRDMALSPDGKTVAVGTVYNTIRLWDVATGRELFEQYQGHDAQVNAVAFSPNGKILASGGDNQQVRLWDSASGKQLRHIKNSAKKIAFSPDGKQLASLWIYDNTVRLWDVARGGEVCRLTHDGISSGQAGTTLCCLGYSPDGRNVFTVDHRRAPQARSMGTARLHVWDAVNGRHLRDFTISELFPKCLAVAPDGKSVALGGGNEALQVWDVETGKLIRAFPGHGHNVSAVAISPDGRTLASGSLDRKVRLWETATGKPIRTLNRHTRSVTALAFAPGGRLLASGSGDYSVPFRGRGPHTIRIWDILTGKEVSHFQGHDSNVTSLAFVADGSRLASGLCNSSVLIWDATLLSRLPAEAKPLAAEERDRLWTELAAEDAARAYEAIGRLVSSPKQSVALLRARLQPAKAAAEPQIIRQLIAELDSNQFTVRDAAFRKLEQLGDEIAPALRQALADRPSLEMRRRLEPLLASLYTVRATEVMRQIRAVQVLEHIGTAEARQVLEKLVEGATGTRQTREAKAALQRLTSRKIPDR